MKKSVFRKLLPIILVIVLFAAALIYVEIFGRSEERRVGKECSG